jgi:hypothetical protein
MDLHAYRWDCSGVVISVLTGLRVQAQRGPSPRRQVHQSADGWCKYRNYAFDIDDVAVLSEEEEEEI